jgi:MFS transporter, FHS family, glucose/mannose:H+ symporter
MAPAMPLAPLPIETRQLKLIQTALFTGFVITGGVATILGPALPIFIARWTLTDAQAGLFFTTQFTGSFTGVVLSSLLLTRGYRNALVIGFLLLAAGVAGLTSATQLVALCSTAVYGFGFGLTIPATNLCIAEIAGARRAAALNLLNMAYGAGAIACPILMLVGLNAGRLTEVLDAMAISSTLLAILFLTMKFEPSAATQLQNPSATHQHQSSTKHPIHVPVALALLFYLYVGAESSISGWIAEQARRIGAGTISTIVPMFFWAGILAGRGASALLLARIKENSLVIVGLLLSAIGITCLLLAPSRAQLIFGVILAGLGFAGIYPVFIAWLSKWYGERARRLGGVMFSLAALGGATVPWTVGFVSQYSRSLRVGLLVPLAGCLAMMLIVSSLRRRMSAA